MAQIKIELSAPLVDGMDIKFQAPCDCSSVTGMLIQYPTEIGTTATKEFTFRDANGNNLANINNLFAQGAYVKVIVDANNGHAYIQNADTNGYLERRIADITPEQIGAMSMELLWENASPSSSFDAQTVEFKNINPDKFVVVFSAASGERTDVLDFKPGETAIAQSICGTDDYASGIVTMFVRRITASTETSMSFSASYIANSSTSWLFIQGAGLPTPVRIYGIKGVSA